MRRTGAAVLVGSAVLLCAAAATAAEWREFRSRRGGFVVRMPGTPQYATRQTDGPGAAGLTIHNYVAQDGETMYVVCHAETPPGAVELAGTDYALAMFRQGFTRGAGGRMVRERSVTLGGAKGSEFVVEREGVQLIGRVGLARGRLYCVMAAGPGAAAAAETTRFLGSFRLTNSTPDGTHTARRPAGRAGPGAGGAPASPRAAAPAEDESGWRARRPAGAEFVVTAPGRLSYQKRSLAGGGEYHGYSHQAGDTLYHLGFRDLDRDPAPGGAQAVLDAERDAVVRELKGRLAIVEPVELGEHPGTQFRVGLPGGRSALVRLYLAGSRLYRLEVTTPTALSYSPDAMRFLGSLRIAGRPAAPAAVAAASPAT